MECFSDAQDCSVLSSSSLTDVEIDNLCLFTDQVDIDQIVFDFPPFELSGQNELSRDFPAPASGKKDDPVEKCCTKAMPLPPISGHRRNTTTCDSLLNRAYRIVEGSIAANEQRIKLRAMDLKRDLARQQSGVKRRQSAETRSYRLKLMAQRVLRIWNSP